MKKIWYKFVNGKDGKPVLAQRPNAPIILWALLAVLGRVVTVSPWHAIFSVTSKLSLIIWAILEIGWGASYFRRTLGTLVLVFMLAARLFG